MYIRKADIFSQPSLEASKQVILTTYAGYDSELRWELETAEEVSVLERLIPPIGKVCDFGIGIGRISKPLLEDMPGISIVGIDSSPAMLDYCRAYMPHELQNRLELNSYEDISKIKSDSVDFAIAVYVLQHIPAESFEGAVSELSRIIKPDGRLYVLNTDKFRAVPKGRPTWFDDKFPQWDIIGRYFEEITAVPYESAYMKKILRTHSSKLLKPKK
jgi:ubiquinone/menaquinone biosynthesis C-methylase UbiE